MKNRGIVFFFLAFSSIGNTHNVKLIKSQSSDLSSTGIDAAFNNESLLKDEDTFFEGSAGVLKTKNSYDDSSSETKNFGFQVLTPSFISIGLTASNYDNTSEEVKTRTTGIEMGKKFLYGKESDDGFKSSFGLKIKADRVLIDQSKTFSRLRRKFDFSLEQTSTGVSISWAPINWAEFSGSYTRFKYNNDITTVKSTLSRFEFIASLFSNVQNTLNSLSDTTKTASLRLIPDKNFDATFSRTYSDDLLTDSQYYVDTFDIGIYYIDRVHAFLTAGEHYSTVDTTKTNFTEISIQINF